MFISPPFTPRSTIGQIRTNVQVDEIPAWGWWALGLGTLGIIGLGLGWQLWKQSQLKDIIRSSMLSFKEGLAELKGEYKSNSGEYKAEVRSLLKNDLCPTFAEYVTNFLFKGIRQAFFTESAIINKALEEFRKLSSEVELEMTKSDKRMIEAELRNCIQDEVIKRQMRSAQQATATNTAQTASYLALQNFDR